MQERVFKYFLLFLKRVCMIVSLIVLLLHKIFWVVTLRHFFMYDQRFGITCLPHLEEKDPFPQDPEDGTNK
jgi:hypothetical protein